KGYQPSYNYGEDIDWRYWPVKDNELRWQLHRHKWFTPMGYAYRVSGNETYAQEWTRQYIDWIRKNPYVNISKAEYELTEDSTLKADAENARFAWRPLEVSHRLQDQPLQFQLFMDSPAFTPEFLTEFLVNYHRHAEHILANYSEQGNHLLFEAQRMLYAGTFFPEFKCARTWRESGVEILNREINVQVYDDGCQYELCPHYHLAAINIFIKALEVADLNGFRNAFPQSYIDTIEKMIMFYADISFPDYTNPCFSDAKLVTKQEMLKNFRNWAKVFPDNQAIRYWATEGMEGALPERLSKGYEKSGFFVFRNSWENDALQMVVKAGPPAFWHNQPDNGTFELWYNGRPLFQDSGSYVYAGEGEVMEWRRWFRQSDAHNTLTLNWEDIETTDSKTLLWKPEGDVQTLVTENHSYKGLRHRRSIFFVDGSYFVIVDEAVGKARGVVNLNWQMPGGNVPNSREDMHFHTEFDGKSNMKLQCFGPETMTMRKEKGWQSPAYMQKNNRMKVSFNVKKEADDAPVRYITVIVPKEEPGDNIKISAKFLDGFNENGLKVQVNVGKDKKRTLGYNL
ncbi:MAG: heparinase II/III family protein, partial [Bacteroidales bacterium]|nr:heparinase II/III family protein [Bacteroidales bacterium]